MLFPCCRERAALLGKALILLVRHGNSEQHESGQKNKVKIKEVPVPHELLVAIPAGFEPATHGVEIRYSGSRLQRAKVRAPLLAGDER